MNAPATQLLVHGDASGTALAPSFERRRLRIYIIQMLLDILCVVSAFVLAGGLYQGTWPAPMALMEGQLLMPIYLTIAATCFLQGIAREEIDDEWLEPYDPGYPVVVTIRARRANDGG